jgi:hypothetical protein
VLTDLFVIGVESSKILLIKKMAKRAVPDIVEESGESKEFLQIEKGREVCFENGEEGGIKLFRENPCHMQGSKRVLETSMFGGGKYPAGALELEDAPKTLNPEGIDHISFCILPSDAIGHHNIMIKGVRD